jgi:hypothetical protein
LFGGGYSGSDSNVMDIYEAASRTWSTASLTRYVRNQAATAAGGKVFFAGGYTGHGQSSAVDVYDTATGT